MVTQKENEQKLPISLTPVGHHIIIAILHIYNKNHILEFQMTFLYGETASYVRKKIV